MRARNRFLLLFALIILAAASIGAQSGGVRFIATSANVSGAGETVRINVTDWSPDSRKDEFVAAWSLIPSTPQAGGGRGGRGGGRGGRGGGRGGRGGDAAAATPADDVPVDPDAVDQ